MNISRGTITAFITAYARAYHATHDDPRIFDDFLADQFYTPDEHSRFDTQLAQNLPPIDPDLAGTNPNQATALAAVMQLMNGPVTLSRSRYTEDCLEVALRAGITQYVILGAGFDTFAFRRPDLLNRVQVFEVDQAATQTMKRTRIAEAGWEIPAALHFVPVDFAVDDLSASLAAAGYDPDRLSFFSWLGVTYYLSREVVFTTLSNIARLAPMGSTLVFDYMDADAFVPDKVARRTRLMQETARRVGEPMISGFDPAMLAAELQGRGFHLEENLSPVEIEARYFAGRSDRYHAFEHVHFAKAVIA